MNKPVTDRYFKLGEDIHVKAFEEYMATEYAKEYNKKQPFEEIMENGNKIVRYSIMSENEILAPILKNILNMLNDGEVEKVRKILDESIRDIESWHKDKFYQKFKKEQEECFKEVKEKNETT